MELRDLRAKISVETDAVIEAVQQATGRDRSEIVRDVLHGWALGKIDEARLLTNRLRAEGITASVNGTPGTRA